MRESDCGVPGEVRRGAEAPGPRRPQRTKDVYCRMPNASRDIVIENSLGLHARPAMQFVDVANRFNSTVTVRKGGPEPGEADGKSIMQMIILAATQGTPLRIEAQGDDAEQAVAELAALVNKKFGEED